MTIKEKANMVAEGIIARGIDAEVKEVLKNGIVKTGIMLGSGNVRPTMYVNENMEVEDMIDNFIKTFNELPENNFDSIVNDFADFDKIKDKIIPVVIMNEDSNCVGRKFLDLNVIYKVACENDGYITIKKEHIDTWNVTEEELYNIALSNVKGTYIMMTMGEALGVSMLDTGDNLMNVVTNKNRVFGAAAILFNDIFLDVYNKYGKFAILPSSIHELLIVNYEDNIEVLNEMVREVNKNEVTPEEWLSDHAYIFDGKEVTMDA